MIGVGIRGAGVARAFDPAVLLGPSLDLIFSSASSLDPQITFTRASSATFFDSAGVLQSAANDVPRLDYNPATLAAQGLLIEESRTNLVTYSAEFDNAAWSKLDTNTTGTPAWVNVAAAPDGTTTADKIIDTVANALHYIVRTPTVTANTAYAWSAFVKTSEYSRVRIRFGKSLTPFTRIGIIVNLNDGSITNSDVGTPTSVSTRSATPVGNGWYRIAVAGIFDTTSTDGHVEVTLIDNSGNAVFAGTGTDGLFVWGAQLEAGAFPTSYIPTTTTSLTRAADVASVNTLSPWFNAAEGTLYGEITDAAITVGGVSRRIANINNGTENNRITVGWAGLTGVGAAFVSNGGITQAGFNSPSGAYPFPTKVALAYATDNFQAAVNGSAFAADTSGTVPSVDRMTLGDVVTGGSGPQNLNGHIRRITYYNTRLPNAQLQALTAP